MLGRKAFGAMALAVLAVLAACGRDSGTPAHPDVPGSTPTAQDQSLTPDDIAITKRIRQSVVADERLSVAARNVAIVTANGRVSLRGHAASASEKAEIGVRAREIAGVENVDNQIETPAPP